MPYPIRNPKTKRLTGKFAAQVKMILPDGKVAEYHVRGFETFASAKLAEDEFRNSLGEVKPKADTGSGTSYREMALDFKASNPGWFRSQTNENRWQVALDYFGDKDVARVRFEQLTAYIEWLAPRLGGRQAPRTKRRYLDAVRKVLRHAWANEKLTKGLPPYPKISDKGKRRGVISWPLERAILGWLDGHGYLVEAFTVRLLASTGMRYGELAMLNRAGPSRIELPPKAEHTGFRLLENETKTDEPRWVALRPELARELRAILAAGGLPKYPHMRHIWNKARDSVGKDRAETLHWLRHTAVTRIKNSGVDLERTKQYVGHSKASVTAGYDHPEMEIQFRDVQIVQRTCGEVLSDEVLGQAAKSLILEATAGIEPTCTVLQTGM